MILEEISRQKYCGWAFCAAVCKEWRAVIERKNFHRLTLQASCLEELKYMVIRQRDLVQYICLNIELSRYTCRSCQRTESFSCMSRHSSIIADTILKLFSVLSTWQPTGRLILELNAYSLSDSEHWFKIIILDLNMKMSEIWSSSRKLPLDGTTQITAGLMASRSRLLVRQLYCDSSPRSALASRKISPRFTQLQGL